MTQHSAPCPVPEEQQPLNEYQELQRSWFFRWALSPFPQLWKPLLWLWLASWLVAGPVAAASFMPSRHWGKFLLTSATGAWLPVGLILLQLYLGWRYVCDRLARPVVCYEESGWFDGQLWQKPPDILSRDRLIVAYELRPLPHRHEQHYARGGVWIPGGVLSWPFLP
ncbi:CGLD27 family protein [Prochlorothrix hollandica]|uniref:CGLD27 family protein n=1 Tax=Prochlorothrix hollandica TaxID=1223 RepID=UPI0033416B01